MSFWHEEQTSRKLDLEEAKRYGSVSYKSYHAPGIGNCDCRVAGTNVDYEKLVQLGFDGLDKEIDAAAEKNGQSTFYEALKLWIESLRKACERYRLQAVEMAEKTENDIVRARALRMGINLKGYYYWNDADSYEELDGYNLRFGLTYVDHETGQRRWKKSRYYYAEVCKNRMVN